MRVKKGDIETNYHVRSFDIEMELEEYQKLKKNPVYIILDNLRSAFNVGSVFRLCDTMRVSGLFLCGYTAFPPHKKLEKTSLGTIRYVPWKHFEYTEDAVTFLQKRGIVVWCAETVSNSVRYDEADYPMPVGIVFGNEALGVGRNIIDMCEKTVEIPTYGYKNSLNVATAVSVIGYKILESLNKGGGLK